MIHSCKTEFVNVVQLGRLETTEVANALYRANELQKAFYFDSASLERNKLLLGDKYRLPNDAFDLCAALKHILTTTKYKKLPRPLLVLSGEALGDPDHPNDPDYTYSSSQEDDYDPSVTIISTYTGGKLPNRKLESYLLLLLSAHILSFYADISYHVDPRGCPLDFCDEWGDVENCFLVGKLCDDCDFVIENKMAQYTISTERVAAAVRLLNYAAGRKYCFVAMPFDKKFDPVYKAVREALIERGWQIKRADEIPVGSINKVILKEILASDLVVADLTGENPNVLYEVGLTHALGNGLLLLSQKHKGPVNLSLEQTVFYKMDQLADLKSSLQQRLPRGTTTIPLKTS